MTSTIVAILVLLAPGLIAVVIYSWLQKKPLESLTVIVGTCAFSFFINLFTFLVMALLGVSVEQTTDLFVYVSTTMKYAAVALAAAVTFPGLVWLLSQIKREKIQ